MLEGYDLDSGRIYNKRERVALASTPRDTRGTKVYLRGISKGWGRADGLPRRIWLAMGDYSLEIESR